METVRQTREEERHLIKAAQRDPARFADHFDRIYAYITRRVRDRAEAQDLTSEVFHQALAHLPQYEWRGVPLATWLYRIAANAIIDRAARAAREPGPLQADLLTEAGIEEAEHCARRLPDDARLAGRPAAGTRNEVRRGPQHQGDRRTAWA